MFFGMFFLCLCLCYIVPNCGWFGACLIVFKVYLVSVQVFRCHFRA